jgi:hypothetical protein
MNEKHMNMVFKIGLLLIGMAFLVVYFLHSQNGRFHKFGGEKNDLFTYHILDTRTGIVYFTFSTNNIPGYFHSVNSKNGSVKTYYPKY